MATKIEDVLREMRELAAGPSLPRDIWVYASLTRWADAFEVAMQEPVAEVVPVIISRKERYTEIRPKRAPASIPGTKLFAFPPDAAGEIERLKEENEKYRLGMQENCQLRAEMLDEIRRGDRFADALEEIAVLYERDVDTADNYEQAANAYEMRCIARAALNTEDKT